MTVVLSFPVPGEPPSINKLPSSRGGQIGWSRKRQAWRDTARAYAEDAFGPDGSGDYFLPSTIEVTIPFATFRRRDPHNYVGTVCKWIIDGLVKAGLWPDDNPDWITVLEPVLVVGDEVRVTITPRAEVPT